MRALFLSVAIAAVVLICSGDASARTAACPCNPCNCAPCTCGQSRTSSSKPQPGKTPTTKTESGKPRTTKSEPGKSTTNKTSKGESYHKGKDRHGEHGSHSDVGIGVNVDLGGIGQRRPEADPFAVPAGPQPVTARTEQKPPPAKKPREVARTDPFANVQLTGELAKEENAPPGPINISDNAAGSSSSIPQSQEKPKGEPAQTTYTDRELPKAFKNLPTGYKVVKTKGGSSFYAEWDSLRPGLPIVWNSKHGVWMPPGFVPEAGDDDRGFNKTSGQNCVWDDKSSQWIDTKTGKALGYEQ